LMAENAAQKNKNRRIITETGQSQNKLE